MYSFDTRVRYSEVGNDKCAQLTSILNYFQDCSIFHSEDVGLGFEYLEKVNRVWLMSAWQIVINRYPRVAERLKVSTWPYGFKSMYGYRNFLLQDERGEVAAYANSIWVYYDTQKQCPVKPTEENVRAYNIEPAYAMEYADRKIHVEGELEAQESFPVVKAYLDNNNHVNNGVYIQLAQEYLPEDFKVRQLRADYRMSALLHDIIVPKVRIGENVCNVVLANEQDKPFVNMEFSK